MYFAKLSLLHFWYPCSRDYPLPVVAEVVMVEPNEVDQACLQADTFSDEPVCNA